MTNLDELMDCKGEWGGEYNLWLDPSGPPIKSRSVMKISPVLKNKFVRLNYTWNDGSEDQEGSLTIGIVEKRKLLVVTWLDTWHMRDEIMYCEGYKSENNEYIFKGDYKVSEGPNWDWRTEIKPRSDLLDLMMYNISPKGDDNLAVKVEYREV